MLESKRKFKRFDLLYGVKFRPTYGAAVYSAGTARNLSFEGIGLDAPDFRFIMYENLELVIDVPGAGSSVSLSGDIFWKRQDGKRCLAGIKFRMKDKHLQEHAIGKIFSSLNVPANHMYNYDIDYIIQEKTEIITMPVPTVQEKKAWGPPDKLGIIKQYYEDGIKCRVTFRLLRETARNTQNVMIVGDFNGWDVSKSPMARQANGDFVITMELDGNREYRYGYLLDGCRWVNDWYADKFVRKGKGTKDSVVIV